eukprot:3277104-Amphidinium_carterae.1
MVDSSCLVKLSSLTPEVSALQLRGIEEHCQQQYSCCHSGLILSRRTNSTGHANEWMQQNLWGALAA